MPAHVFKGYFNHWLCIQISTFVYFNWIDTKREAIIFCHSPVEQGLLLYGYLVQNSGALTREMIVAYCMYSPRSHGLFFYSQCLSSSLHVSSPALISCSPHPDSSSSFLYTNTPPNYYSIIVSSLPLPPLFYTVCPSSLIILPSVIPPSLSHYCSQSQFSLITPQCQLLSHYSTISAFLPYLLIPNRSSLPT